MVTLVISLLVLLERYVKFEFMQDSLGFGRPCQLSGEVVLQFCFDAKTGEIQWMSPVPLSFSGDGWTSSMDGLSICEATSVACLLDRLPPSTEVNLSLSTASLSDQVPLEGVVLQCLHRCHRLRASSLTISLAASVTVVSTAVMTAIPASITQKTSVFSKGHQCEGDLCRSTRSTRSCLPVALSALLPQARKHVRCVVVHSVRSSACCA